MANGRSASPTAEQMAWMNANKSYQRMSHSVSSKYVKRGTLLPDGTLRPEAPGAPIMDGNGCFGVGIPVAQAKPRR